MNIDDFYKGLLAHRCAEVNLWEEVQGVAIRRTQSYFEVIHFSDTDRITPAVRVEKRFPLTLEGIHDAVTFANACAEASWCRREVSAYIKGQPFTERECIRRDQLPMPKRDELPTSK